MKKVKVTDIFGYIKELDLEYLEQLFLQAIKENNTIFKLDDNDTLYLKLPPDIIVTDLQKSGIEELKAEGKEVAYITRDDKLIVFAAYMSVNFT